MPRGLFAGATDYSHQTFHDILDDLNNWKTALIRTSEEIKTIIKELNAKGYWKKVPDNFTSLIAYAVKFYETGIVEIDDIINNLKVEVQQNHISRLRSLAKTAHELNQDFGRVWHREYGPKDYGESNFSKVEFLYARGRDMVIDMLDMSNVAERLEDYIGMKNEGSKKRFSKKFLVQILLLLLSTIIAIISNVASSILPLSFQPYLWVSWPLLVILLIIFIIIQTKQ